MDVGEGGWEELGRRTKGLIEGNRSIPELRKFGGKTAGSSMDRIPFPSGFWASVGQGVGKRRWWDVEDDDDRRGNKRGRESREDVDESRRKGGGGREEKEESGEADGG